MQGTNKVLYSFFILLLIFACNQNKEKNNKTMNDNDSTKTKTKKIKTPLSRKNDTEGLCYDKKNQYFLIACKERAEIKNGADYKGKKANILKFNYKDK